MPSITTPSSSCRTATSARYGSITSEWEHFAEWKRLDEADRGSLDAEVLLNGMLAHDRLLDIVENFILFDESKPGATRKDHREKPPGTGGQPGGGVRGATGGAETGVSTGAASYGIASWSCHLNRVRPRRTHRRCRWPPNRRRPPTLPDGRSTSSSMRIPISVGSGCSGTPRGAASPTPWLFFAEKVRRKLEGNFTFLLMTDRNDLDGQIYRTFVGCGIADDNTPRAASGDRSGRAAEGEPPLPLQPDPQVQQGRRPEAALQRARRHHRDLRRSASHPGRAAGPQHAPRAAERGLHRLHRHTALQAGPAHEAHLRGLRLALRLQAVRRRTEPPSSSSTRTGARSWAWRGSI